MLKLKFQYFGHLMRRVDSLEKSLMLGGIGKWEKTASAFQPRMGCISLISQYLSELQIRTVAHIQATNHRQKRLVSLLCP